MSNLAEYRFLVTGGAGFIGSAFVRMLLSEGAKVLVLDALTYAGNISNISDVLPQNNFINGDIADKAVTKNILEQFDPHFIVNFAAESHVDRSVGDPTPFVATNIAGTQSLLEVVRQHINSQTAVLRKFVHISTDEVYGDLPLDFDVPKEIDEETKQLLGRTALLYGAGSFAETSPLKASSPYSASKAAADLMVLAYHRTYGLPVVITRCSNNYGPRQFPEKLIPLMLNNLLEHKELPVYGQGNNVRDWIHVDDHCRGIIAALLKGKVGQVYNFGGYAEQRNIDIVRMLINIVAKLSNDSAINEDLIRFVGDRPGHDLRYAIDARRAMTELGWCPKVEFRQGLEDTVKWYLNNRQWVENVVNGEYRTYYSKMYSKR